MERIISWLYCSYLSFRALYVWLIPQFYVGTKFITPFFQVAFFALVAKYARGDEGMIFAAVGNTVQIMAVNGIMGVSIVIALERAYGTLSNLIITPASRTVIFTRQIVFQILDSIFGALICLFYSWLFFGINLNSLSWLTFIVLLALIGGSLSCMGIIVGAIGLISNNVVTIMNVIYLILMLICGVNVPLSEYPHWIRYLSDMIPLTYGISAVRASLNGASFIDLLHPYIFPMLILAAVYYTIGILMLKYCEHKNRVLGTLD